MVFAVQMIFEATRAITTLVFLLYASWSDHKTREVSNAVWVLFAPIALALTFFELYIYDFSMLPMYGMSFVLTTAFAIALFYSGGFGGADAKALMCLALALPFYPANRFTPIVGEISPISQNFFPITVFSNSVLLAAASAVFMFAYNIGWHIKNRKSIFEGDHKKESVWRKTLVLLTGYKMPLTKVKEKWHLYPLEDAEKTSEATFKRKLIILPKDEGRNDIIGRLEKANQTGAVPDKVWATPGLPMLIFVTAGLIIALLLGDVIWNLILFLLG